MENSESYSDLESLHIYVGSSYALIGIIDKAKYHFKKAIDLAQTYNLFFPICIEFYYMKPFFDEILSTYPNDLKEKINSMSEKIHDCYIKFIDCISNNNIYKMLPRKYYTIFLYTAQGLTNKEIAQQLNMSESSVAKQLGELYDITGVSNKNDLINLYNSLINHSILPKYI